MAALDAHVAVPHGRWAEADAVQTCVKRALEERFGISHVTLETECAAHVCDGAHSLRHG